LLPEHRRLFNVEFLFAAVGIVIQHRPNSALSFERLSHAALILSNNGAVAERDDYGD
jgi:hypothetical protein